VATTMLLTGLPEVTPEAQACVRAFVEANPELVGAAFASGGGDSPATQQFSLRFAAACPEAAGA
jgi:hypothetical protein